MLAQKAKNSNTTALGNVHDKRVKAERLAKAKGQTLSLQFIEETFITISKTHDIEFMRNKDGARFGLAYVVYRWLLDEKRHNQNPTKEAVSIHHDYLYFYFGKRMMPRLLHVFEQGDEWSKEKQLTGNDWSNTAKKKGSGPKTTGFTRSIKPRNELHEVLGNMTSSAHKGRMVRFNGEKLEQVRVSRLEAVPYKRRDTSLSINGMPVVDIERLKAGEAQLDLLARRPQLVQGGIYAKEIKIVKAELAEVVKRNPKYSITELLQGKAIRSRQQIREIIKAADSQGRLRQKYYECSDGRWFTRGLSLQSVSNLVMHTALAGCTEYDFHASDYVLLLNVANDARKRFGKVLEIDAISHYIDNKDQERKGLAARLGITEKQAKALYSSLPCGGGLSVHDDNDMMAVDKAAILLDPNYGRLHDQVKSVTRFMIGGKYAPVEKYNKVIKNAKGLTMEAHRKSTERKAFMLFGLQVLATESGMRAHTVGNDKPVMMKADSWMTREAQCPQDAIDAIRNDTRNDTPLTLKLNKPKLIMPSGMK